MASRRKGRVLAFQALYAWEANKSPAAAVGNASLGPSSSAADFAWLDTDKKAALDDATSAFAKLLVMGTLENVEKLDALIRKHLKNWDFSRLNRVDLALIRMSAYSLVYQDDVPPSIVIDEAIDIAKEYGTDDSYRFVNGVLDGIRKTVQAGDGPATTS